MHMYIQPNVKYQSQVPRLHYLDISKAMNNPFALRDIQERVFNVHEDTQSTSPEVVSLIRTAVTPNNCVDTTTPERIATPPPTPPQRLDTISLKAG
jgi:hypothetical protein